MPDVREADAAAERTDDVPVHDIAGTVVLELAGAEPISPNKVVWSRGGAVSAARRRRRLRQDAGLLTTARVPFELRHRVAIGDVTCTVTIVRVAAGKGKRMDDDNWQAAAKPIRDGIADAFSQRDDWKAFVWKYDQIRDYQPFTRGVVVRLDFTHG